MNASDRQELVELIAFLQHSAKHPFISTVRFLSGKDEQPANDEVPF